MKRRLLVCSDRYSGTEARKRVIIIIVAGKVICLSVCLSHAAIFGLITGQVVSLDLITLLHKSPLILKVNYVFFF